MVFGFGKDKLEGSVPDEFLKDAQLMKETREHTADLIKYMEKMVRTAIPHNTTTNANQTSPKTIPMDELQALSKTCENSMHFFYEQRYYYVLKSTSEVCNELSKLQKHMIQETHDRAVMPIKIWAEEDYQRLVHDLQKCQKLKKESDSATVEYTSKPTLAKERKANAAKEHYEQQLRMCNGEMDKARKIRKHHTNCLKLMVAMHYKYSKSVIDEVEKAQSLLRRQLTVMDEIGHKDKTVKTGKQISSKEKTARSKRPA